MTANPLGKNLPAPDQYNPEILHPIPRRPARTPADSEQQIRMYGIDHWHAYELSWLNPRGKPMVAVAEFFFNAESENIVESKSLKLYLNSFNQEKFENSEKLAAVIQNDLSAVSKSKVKVSIQDLEQAGFLIIRERRGKSIDALNIDINVYQPDESLLIVGDDRVFDERLFSDLFKSNCPVTGAPDWASFTLRYSGARIEEDSLLRYLCSFRLHQAYHEECAERIYRDIMRRCTPDELSIALNFVRRGGLDINVYRSSVPVDSNRINRRLLRQ